MPFDSCRPRLAILVHSRDQFWRRGHLVQLLMPRWQRMGIRVDVVTERDPCQPADLALLHVNLTTVPQECLRAMSCHPLVINGSVSDISKRRFSQSLADRNEPGMVVVKTDANCGGRPEFRHRLQRSSGWLGGRLGGEDRLTEALTRLDTLRPWSRVKTLVRYPLFPSGRAVPPAVWTNLALVVERFRPERSGTSYRCRHWIFFGTREVHRVTTSPDPLTKRGRVVEPLDEDVPAELRALRRELGFDYGKFDYGTADGAPVLYDVNRTPGVRRDITIRPESLDLLADGLLEFLPEEACRRAR